MYQELIKLHCFKIVYMEALQLYFNIPELKGFAYLIFFLSYFVTSERCVVIPRYKEDVLQTSF